MIWSLIYLALSMIGLGMVASDHGKPKTGNNNFWTSSIAWLTIVFLLYKGGFFNTLIQAL